MDVKRGNLGTARNNFVSKKGQITVFIIIGIIILFVFAGVLFVIKTTSKDQVSTAGSQIITSAPEGFTPVQAYTQDCLDQVSTDTLISLGEQGGYLYPDLVGTFSPTNPTNADGLEFNNLLIPYWFYNSQPDEQKTITFSSHKPELSVDKDSQLSIEAQLARDIKEKLTFCLNDYSAFTAQGYSIEQGAIQDVQVKVVPGAVNVIIEMPVEASLGDVKESLERFAVQLDVDLQHLYDVATTIINTQRDYKFLEKQGLDLLSVYSRKDSSAFAPISSTGFKFFSPYSWNENTLHDNFQGLLTSYVPMLRYLGSSNFNYAAYPIGELLAQKVADNMVLPLTGAEDLNINFDYFNWPIFFSTNSEDGVIRPDNQFIDFQVLNFAQQTYDTHYDISYPVMVTLEDPNALRGQGYKFIFSLEANIRNNRVPSDAELASSSPQQITSLACGTEQRNTELLQTLVLDSYTKEPLANVSIGFTIPNQAECDIGVTDSDGVSSEKYPAAYGGVVNFINPDYLSAFYPIDTYSNVNQPGFIGYAVAGMPERVVELNKIKTIDVTVKKKELKKCVTPLRCSYTEGAALGVIPFKDISCQKAAQQCFFNQGSSLLQGEPLISFQANSSISKFNDYYFINQPKDLADNEQVFITLERVKGLHDEVVEDPYFTTVSISGNEISSMDLVPGYYKVTAMATLKKEITIPLDKRCESYDIITWSSQKCFKIEAQSLAEYLEGNILWETEPAYFKVTPEDLYVSNLLTFTVPVQDITAVPESIQTTAEQCSSILIAESCSDKTINTPGKLVEDLQVPALLAQLSGKPALRKYLEPQFS